MKTRPQDRGTVTNGFTLIELIVVLAVIGMTTGLVVAALPTSGPTLAAPGAEEGTEARLRRSAVRRGVPITTVTSSGHQITALPDGRVVSGAARPDPTELEPAGGGAR